MSDENSKKEEVSKEIVEENPKEISSEENSEETVEEVPITIEVKREYYRQLDFLRLFKVCRDRGLLNRKRKMPVEYCDDDPNKNDRNARSACRRLLRTLITSLFPENFKVKSNFNNYFVEIPSEIKDIIIYFNNHSFEISRSTDLNIQAAQSTLRELSRNVGNIVFPRLPFSIRINFAPYSGYIHTTHNSYIHRPRETFYRCAKACIEFKDKWDTHYPIVENAVELFKLELQNTEKSKRELEKRRNEQNRQAQERQENVRRQLADAVAQSQISGPRNTQESFNTALRNLMQRRGNE